MNTTQYCLSTMLLALFAGGCDNLDIAVNFQGTSISRNNGVLTVKIDSEPLTEGSGKLAEDAREAGVFRKLECTHGIEVKLIDEPSEFFTVESDDNLLPLIETKIENETLRVRVAHSLKTRNPIRVKVYTEKLSAVVADSSASITGGRMRGTLVELKAESSSRIVFEDIECDRIKVNANSSGTVVVQHAISKTLEASVDSSARVTLSGEVDEQHVTVSSSGKFDGKKLHSHTTNVKTSSSGTAIVQASKIEGSASSSGRVVYLGDPEHLQVHTNSSGTVSKQK